MLLPKRQIPPRPPSRSRAHSGGSEVPGKDGQLDGEREPFDGGTHPFTAPAVMPDDHATLDDQEEDDQPGIADQGGARP